MGLLTGNKSKDEYFTDLVNGMRRVFGRFNRALLLVEEKWLALLITDDLIYVWNSHGIDSDGSLIPFAPARAFDCKSLFECVKLIAAGLQQRLSAAYHLHGILVKQINGDSSSD